MVYGKCLTIVSPSLSVNECEACSLRHIWPKIVKIMFTYEVKMLQIMNT